MRMITAFLYASGLLSGGLHALKNEELDQLLVCEVPLRA
jgi:hypothetical protein